MPNRRFLRTGIRRELSYNHTAVHLSSSGRKSPELLSTHALFSSGALITGENQSEEKIRAFYFCIDYEEHETINSDQGRFHACWRRELTDPLPESENEWRVFGESLPNADGEDNYVMADIEGKGHFVGVQYKGRDIHIWRDAWRKLSGNRKLWGNEKIEKN
jgi:hypothetical protein